MGRKRNKATLDDSYPYNQKAKELFAEFAINNYTSYLSEAKSLRNNKTLSKSINNIDINFKVAGNHVLTDYLLHNGKAFTTTRKFNSIFANNDALSELVIELAKAQVNAVLAKNVEDFEIYNFPAFGFISSDSEQHSLNYRLRQLLKKPFLFSITSRFR